MPSNSFYSYSWYCSPSIPSFHLCSGSDAASIQTRATLSEDKKHFILNGSKVQPWPHCPAKFSQVLAASVSTFCTPWATGCVPLFLYRNTWGIAEWLAHIPQVAEPGLEQGSLTPQSSCFCSYSCFYVFIFNFKEATYSALLFHGPGTQLEELNAHGWYYFFCWHHHLWMLSLRFNQGLLNTVIPLANGERIIMSSYLVSLQISLLISYPFPLISLFAWIRK